MHSSKIDVHRYWYYLRTKFHCFCSAIYTHFRFRSYFSLINRRKRYWEWSLRDLFLLYSFLRCSGSELWRNWYGLSSILLLLFHSFVSLSFFQLLRYGARVFVQKAVGEKVKTLLSASSLYFFFPVKEWQFL